MKKTETEIVRVAIDVPVRKLFDYLPPENFTRSNLRPGVRVIVPFGRKKNSIGLIIETSDFASVEKAKLKRVIKFIDNH